MLKIAAASIAAAALLAAPPAAHASEAGYLARLAVDYGLTITEADQAQTVAAGQVLCDYMRDGMPREKVAATLVRRTTTLTIEQAEGIAYAAQRELCPDTAE